MSVNVPPTSTPIVFIVPRPAWCRVSSRLVRRRRPVRLLALSGRLRRWTEALLADWRALFSVHLIEKATVKAVVIHAPGAPEQLVIAEVPEPQPGPGEVLVDVAFAGCNWADTQIRTGIYPHARTYPLVLGLEISGTVAKLGPGVSGVKIGERVAAFLEQGGAYAQKAVVAANMLMRLPDSIPFDVGAALTVQPLTGYHMLHTIYSLKPNDTVLINAI